MTDYPDTLTAQGAALLGSAWSFLDRSEEVELIWVYVSFLPGVATYNAYYQIKGQVMDAADAAEALGCDASDDAQMDLSDSFDGPVYALRSEAPVDALPTRIIFRYRVSDQDFNADLTYDDLQPGVPDDDRKPLSAMERQWVARLTETGEDGADPF